MDCRDMIVSEDYMSILLDYIPGEEERSGDWYCYRQIDGALGVYYMDIARRCPFLPPIICTATSRSFTGWADFRRWEAGSLTRRRWKSPGYWHSSGRRWN